jgi:glutathione-regulated potassium-efflux system ancillary protein KefC/glutathione-regulated potassium-efflux system protein KefB
MTLLNIAFLLAAAIFAVPLSKRAGLGSVLGYLIAGLLVGPSVLGVIVEVETIRHVSEFGVVLLLFVIGLELKPARLWVMRRMVFGLGAAQVLLTTAVLGFLAWRFAGLTPVGAAVVGFGLSLSSTAFVLPLLAEHKSLQRPHGQAAFSVLLFQDLSVIPVLALLPALAMGTNALPTDARETIETIKIIGATLGGVAVALVVGQYLLRPMLRLIAGTGHQEVFTAATLFVVIAAASLSEAAGLSMSLGAFLAGVLLADSEYRHELEADIEPFKGLFLGLFFMGVGMTANLSLLAERPATILGIVAGLIVIKAVVLFGLSWLTRCDRSEARNLGVALAQAGEFGFVLYALAGQGGMLDAATVDLLVLVVTLSMAATPLLFAANVKFLDRLFVARDTRAFDTIAESDSSNPVIIAGFGRMGQIVGRMLRAQHISFTALDVSAEEVDFLRKYGNRIYYGDASRLDLLQAAGADKARLLVIAIDDVDASVRTLETARRHFPRVRILIRVRNRQHAIRAMQLGVPFEDVIRETYGSGLNMARRALFQIGQDEARIARAIDIFVKHDERVLRKQAELGGGEAHMIQTARESAAELEQLFSEDQQSDRESEAA